MGSFVNVLLSNIEVETKEGCLYISGLSPDLIKKDIRNVMNKSDVASSFIEIVGWRIIKIPLFFVLEFYFLLKEILHNRRVLCDVRQIGRLIEILEKDTWISDTKVTFPSKMDYKLQADFNAKLFDFQSKFLERYDQVTQQYHLKGMLLAGAAGSGKTLTSLVTMHCLKCDKIIIVCPKNAVYKVWEDNINRFFKVPQSIWTSPDNYPYKNERFIILNYEYLSKIKEILKDSRVSTKFGIILDESHNLNEIKTNRAQLFIDLCKYINAKEIIFASGTPIKALAIEAITLMYAIDPYFNEEVATIFRKLYNRDSPMVKELIRRRLNEVVYKIEKSQLGLDEPIFNYFAIQTPNGKSFTLDAIRTEMVKYAKEKTSLYKKNMPKYIDAFNTIVDSVEKKLLSLNPKDTSLKSKFQEYRVTVDHIRKFHNQNKLSEVKDDMALCSKFEKDVIMPAIDVKDTKLKFKELKTIVKYYKFKIQGDILGKIVLGARIAANVALAERIDYDKVINSTTKKTVIFTPYIEVAEKSVAILTSKDYTPTSVYGDKVSKLREIVTEFETKPNVNPLVATYASLSTAVPLVVADTMLCIGLPYRDYQLNQAISRIHRLGADTQCCINIVTLDTGKLPNITSRTVDILRWSQEQIKDIVGMEIPYQIEDVKNYKDIDSMHGIVNAGIAELLLQPDELADKFISFMNKIKPMLSLKNWRDS